MSKRVPDLDRNMHSDLIRSGLIAGVWVVFYILLMTNAVSTSKQTSLSAKTAAPDWRAAAADVARLPNAPAPVRNDAFGR